MHFRATRAARSTFTHWLRGRATTTWRRARRSDASTAFRRWRRPNKKGGIEMNALCIPCVLHAATGAAGTTSAQQDLARALVKMAAIAAAIVVLWLLS
jgi:hypothetical protein